MRKIFFICLAFLLAPLSWGSAVLDNAAYETLQAGSQKVNRLVNSSDKDFLLSNIIYPQQKKEIGLIVSVGFKYHLSPAKGGVFADYEDKNPGYQEAEQLFFDYFSKAWNDWRNAANDWLPVSYQLPDLKLYLVDGYKWTTSKNKKWPASAIKISLQADVGTGGFMSSDGGYARGIGMPLFTKSGKGEGLVRFMMEEQWWNWMNSKNRLPEQQAQAAQYYKEVAASVLAGEYFYQPGSSYSKLSSQAQEYADVLSKSNPQDWQRQGPWATFNQHIFTHELGHLFGLTHNEEETSIMNPTISGTSTAKISSADGLRLATMVCWYHNQRTQTQNCVPLNESLKAQRIRKQIRLDGKLEKSQLALNSVPEMMDFSVAPKNMLKDVMAPEQTRRNKSIPSIKEDVVFTGSISLPANRREAKKWMKQNQASQKQIPSVSQQQEQSVPAGTQQNSSAKTQFMPLQKTPVQLANAVPAQKEPRLKTLPAVLPTAAAPANPNTAAASQEKAPGTQQGPKKPVCFICGQEIDGDYYSFTESRHVHKHSFCAYKAFAMYHKTDEKSLVRYEDFYFLHTPNDVVQARENLQNLGLTTADIRRYSLQDATEQAKRFRKFLEEREASKQAAQARAEQEEKCSFYMHVTREDVSRYAAENQAVLRSIAKKQQSGRTLSKKEARVQQYYEQLNKNYELTQYCEGLSK